MRSAEVDAVRATYHALLDGWVRRLLPWRTELGHSPVVTGGLLAALLATMVFTALGSRRAAVAALPLALLWLVFNGSFEGPTLIRLSYSHGVTATDLLSVGAVMLSAWRLVPVVLPLLRS